MPILFLLMLTVAAGLVALVMTVIAWIIISIFRLVGRVLDAIFRPSAGESEDAVKAALGGWRCQRGLCRTINPSHARFCRRCGRMVMSEPTAARPAMTSL
jgi:hypothetical protein